MVAYKVDKQRPIRYLNKERTLIDIHILIPGVGSSPHTTQKGEELFAQAESGLFGPVQSWTPPAIDISVKQYDIMFEFHRRIETSLKGKSASMLREAMFLQTLTTLTDDQKYEQQVFKDINDWETAMVEKREELVARGDTNAAKLDKTWPKLPPSVTDDFLKGF